MSGAELVEVISSPSPAIQEPIPGVLPATSASPASSEAIHSPSTTGTPNHGINGTPPKTPKSPFAARIMTPLASPMKKAIESMQGCLEEIGHFTKFDPQEAWLPITESRNGNAYYAAFHTLSSGIGVQALVLPLAFTALGWTWGIICLSLAFMWQLYTLWLLIQLHESVAGMRYSRYLWLSMAVFGNKVGKLLALFPTMYLSGGTCVTLIMIGGGTMKMFYQIVCESSSTTTHHITPLSMTEWYLVFTLSAVILAQLPNLNSIAGVSLIGAVTAVSYCTIIWVVSVVKDRPAEVSYEPIVFKSEIGRICSILNALGIIAFAFRGHNLVLEIQGTMPSSLKHPSRLPMWKGVKFSYLIIALCLFPLAIGGYWAYGDLVHSNTPLWTSTVVLIFLTYVFLHIYFSSETAIFEQDNNFSVLLLQIPSNGGIMSALDKYHRYDTSKVILGVASLFIVLNSLTSFQIYAMPVFDNLEFRYTSNNNRPCPWWLRAALRMFFGCLAFFLAVAFPFLPSLAGLIGGFTLPVTFAYPCIMWILTNKAAKHSAIWYLNLSLGSLGIVLSILLVFGAIWTIVTQGIEVHFFKPQ